MLTLYTSDPFGLHVGNGKTLWLTYEAYKQFVLNNRMIFSNYKLKFKFNHFPKIEDVFKLTNSIILIDELPVYLNSYDSMVSGNRDEKKFKRDMFLLPRQARKKGLDIIISAQDLMDVPKNWRRMVQKTIYCYKYHIDNGELCNKDRCRFKHFFISINADNGEKKLLLPAKAETIFSKYDSNEIIYPS